VFASGDVSAFPHIQLVAPPLRELLRTMRPTAFEELVAALAICRPGPLDAGWADELIRRKRTTIHPLLDAIVAPTYGLVVYQEQLMLIAHQVAGYTFAEADIFRRALAKARPEAVARERRCFTEGALHRGLPPAFVDGLFARLERDAPLTFNRSHAVASALLAYRITYAAARVRCARA
jgi:DNA polymerase III subunit alpha